MRATNGTFYITYAMPFKKHNILLRYISDKASMSLVPPSRKVTKMFVSD